MQQINSDLNIISIPSFIHVFSDEMTDHLDAKLLEWNIS